MSANNTSGIILIKQGAPLSPGLLIDTEGFLPAWNVVKNLDRGGLVRKIESACWHFFFLAGPIKSTVVGRDTPAALRRAVKRVLPRREGRNFNSLEITKIVSRRFLFIPFLSITAFSRHIQEGICLVPAKDFVLRMPVAPPSEKLAAQNFAPVSPSS